MSRLSHIDGLRGLAITLVFLRHYYMHAYEFGLPRWADAFSFGWVGVHLFLLLSGLCIGYRFVGPNAYPFEWGDFWKRRLQRILPAYYIVLLFCLITVPLPSSDFWMQTIAHALMLHNLTPLTATALNPPFWSLALECQLYLLFPLFLGLWKRWGVLGMLSVVLLCQIFYRSLFLGMNSRLVDSWAFVLPWGVLGRMFEFVLGLTVAIWLQRDSSVEGKKESGEGKKESGEGIRVPRYQRILLFCGIPFFLICAYLAQARFDILHPLSDFCFSLCFFCLLVSASLKGSFLKKLFSIKIFVGIGQISYSIYLTHEIFLRFLFDKSYPWNHYFHKPLLALIPTCVISLLFSYIVYRLIEKPAIDYFARAKKPSRPASNIVL